MPSAAQVGRGASSFNEIADTVREELAAVGLCDADDDGNLAAAAGGDEAAPDGEEEEAAEAEAADFETCKSVLQAAALLIQVWDASGSAEPLRLPTFLTLDDRAALHAFCERRELGHVTDADADGEESSISRLVVSRRPGWTGWSRAAGSSSGAAGSSAAHAASGAAALSERERMYSALQFNENWAKLRIKYDPRHWMGNWFLMAASKTSPLFKYFCCATADAMFKVGTNPDPNPNPNPNPN